MRSSAQMRVVWIVVLLLLSASAPPRAATPPNLLFIYADDLGWKDVGYQGTDFYETPNIDRLAQEGMIFTQSYAGAGNCAPSRACLLSEGGVRGAACVAWPGRIKAGTVVTQPLHMVDWYPTLVKLAGASLEQKLPVDGRDAWATIAAGQASPHAEILINAAPMSGALRAGNWKLVLNGEGHEAEVMLRENGRELSSAPAKIELFDLAADPGERRNVAEAHPGKVQELRARYQALADQAVPPKLKPRDPNFKTPKVWGSAR